MNKGTNAKYSILIAGGDWPVLEIKELLKNGLKVIWFCNVTDEILVKEELNEFCKAGFCEVYINTFRLEVEIEDGKFAENESVLKRLERGDTRFNVEQYLIEHQDSTKNLIIEAGAGTGKTHVMINRIMYLMHTDAEFHFSKVAMITFTNKATDNMRHRLINLLDAKYKLTGKLQYLEKIEELAQINVSTIHAFFKKVITEVGPILGYGTNIQLRSMLLEKKELLRDLLDKRYGKSNAKVDCVIGLPLHSLEKLAIEYWTKIDSNGVNTDEHELQWGETSTPKAQLVQNSLIDIFEQVDAKYNEIKYINNAISMQDIIHELSRVINRDEIKEYITHKYKYMFCDEFQDSDNVQIQTIAILNRVYEGNLFVVGDVKQSIYRFRGATDSSFKKLNEMLTLEEKERLVNKSLTKNYRTTETILDGLDSIFRVWGNAKLGLLQYQDTEEKSDKLRAQVKEKGEYSQIVIGANDREKKVIETIKKIQKDSKHKKITCLTRKNEQLRTIKSWCEKEKIVCLIRERGSFFTSDAVLDFCCLIEAYLYENEPMYLYNYILSSYGNGKVDHVELAKCNGDKYKVFDVLLKEIDIDCWNINRHDLKNKPVMSIIRRMVLDLNPVESYGIRRKFELIEKGYPEEKAINQAVIDTIQYEANLAKLLQLLTDEFAGDFSSLVDLCDFLRLKIMTDREEEPAEIRKVENISYVEGMTVHGAKGLEFENVLIPFMNDTFVQTYRSDIIFSSDYKSVGWVYREKACEDVKNCQYDILFEEENREVTREETRLLYVAMTRAIYGLYCFLDRRGRMGSMPNTWAELLPREKDNAENNRL